MKVTEIQKLTNTELLTQLGFSVEKVPNTSKGLANALEQNKKYSSEESEKAMLLYEFVKRWNGKPRKPRRNCHMPEDIFEYFRFRLGDEKQELFYVVLLDVKCNVMGEHLVSKGTLDCCVVHPRDIFRKALEKAAASIIVAHNHTTEDVSPSKEDIALTKRLVKAGKTLGVPLLDHVIVSSQSFFSLEKHYLL